VAVAQSNGLLRALLGSALDTIGTAIELANMRFGKLPKTGMDILLLKLTEEKPFGLQSRERLKGISKPHRVSP
jgi:hypothetical protein